MSVPYLAEKEKPILLMLKHSCDRRTANRETVLETRP